MKKILFLAIVFFCFQIVHAQGDLFIGAGATIYTTGSSSIVTLEKAKMTNNGLFSANDGTVFFKGNGTNIQSSISGIGISNFKNVTIDKTINGVQLNKNINVSGNLTLTSGGMELNSGNVDFGTTGSLQSETEANRVSGGGGHLRRVSTLNAPNDVNPGNLGAALTSAENLGSTEILRSHVIATPSGSSIERRYSITPTNNSNLNATLRFYYLDAELNGNAESVMVLWRSTDNAATWTQQAGNTRDIANNWVQQTGIPAFSLWTLAAPDALPIEMLSFKGANKGSYNLLEWLTGSENDNAGFDIERSQNAITFEKIGFAPGKESSNEQQSYFFTDLYPHKGVSYYRLKQVDYNGKFEYSDIIAIKQNDTKEAGVFPNPGNGVFNIVGLENAENEMFTLTNNVGQILLNSTVPDNRQFDLSSFPPGIYYLRMASSGQVIRLVKE